MINTKKLIMVLAGIMLLSVSFMGNGAKAIEGDGGNAKGVPILMYHTFEDNPKFQFPGINVSTENFRAQLSYLKKNGFVTILPNDLKLFELGLKKLPVKPIMITIDDGYESVYTQAYPILKEFDMKAVFLVITSHIESGERFNEPMVTWEQIKEMSDSGYVEIGNHTHDLHWRGRGNTAGFEAMITNETKDGKIITNAQREQNIYDDLKTAHQLIEQRTGVSPTLFAYPYGAFDKVAERAVGSSGYEMALTVQEGVHFIGDGTMRLKRLGINNNVHPMVILEKINKSLNARKNKAGGWLNVFDGSSKIEKSFWIKCEQYSNHTIITEGRFELYKRDAKGNRKYLKNFGQYT
ncbi:polysaccharide deacetylase family protein [Sporosarcina sp. FA9]|uniref:polysaccharide deacetylase family protein n=1 Tax=Sporosarcina sp. FA9 TaxID=3413030 RepID=UPI003F659C6E